MFWPVDTHCNAAGYRLVAEACARAWAERFTADGSPPRPARPTVALPTRPGNSRPG